MYTEFYGFKEKPFNIISDPSFLYMSPKHRMALTYLEYGLTDGVGFILLTGEIGTGKTTLIKQLLQKVKTEMEVAVVFNTNVSAEELLELILNEFELAVPARGKGGALDVLNEFLINKHGLGERVLLIVDEAQNLSQDALEEIRMLSNLQTDKASLIQILLVGQPALRTRLQHPSLVQLGQRVAVSYHLRALSLEETGDYIAHRLKIAGGKNEKLLTPDAVKGVFEYAGGIPRTINILCDAALVYGYADELTVINGRIIENVIQDREEAGMLAPVRIGEEAGGQPDGGAEGAGMLGRIEQLEERVHHLSAMVDYQMKELEARSEGYKDTLVQRLEGMLKAERQRADRLLVQYNLLRDRWNLKQLRSQDENTEDGKAGVSPFSVVKDTRSAGTKGDGSARPKSRRLRKWFSK